MDLKEATEQTDAKLSRQTFIQQIRCSNLGQVTVNITYIRFFVVALTFSKKFRVVPQNIPWSHRSDLLNT